MKKTLFTLLAIGMMAVANAQTPLVMNAAGKYEPVKKARAKTTAAAIPTGKFMQYKDSTVPIFKTARGKFFVIRKSKLGKEYKQYVKTN